MPENPNRITRQVSVDRTTWARLEALQRELPRHTGEGWSMSSLIEQLITTHPTYTEQTRRTPFDTP
jgi:hypothetical protein